MSSAVTLFGDRANMLGESPLWDAESDTLWWVDSVARLICRADANGSCFQSWPTPSMIGSVGLAGYGLIAALEDGFHYFDPADGGFTPIALPEAGQPNVRFNDGKADRQGRYVCGTMRFGGAEGAPGKLYRLGADGRVQVVETGIAVSNAICFSPAGRTLYFADSVQHRIWAYDYDPESGSVANRRVLIDTAPLRSPPDGATVDAAGNLWVALVLAQRIVCLSPDGDVLRLVNLPAPYPSCPAFGGADMTTLFVTTIGHSPPMIVSDHPNAGRMLTITGLNATGIAETRCTLSLPERV